MTNFKKMLVTFFKLNGEKSQWDENCPEPFPASESYVTIYIRLFMKNKDFYSTSHLIVAAIRIYEYQNAANPSVEDLCKALSFSLEQGYFICKKLSEIGIIDMVVKGGTHKARLFVNDYMKIEEIPRDTEEITLQEEIERFQNSKKDFKEQIESFQAEKAERQKTLFEEIENKLKEGLNKK